MSNYGPAALPRIPRLSAAAKRAGAVSVKRASANCFHVAYKLEGEDRQAPGCGAAVCEALRAQGLEVEWGGCQWQAILVRWPA